MLFRGTLTAAASGSLAGITASRNRGGAYLRARTTPTNPNSGRQQEVRNALSAIQEAWKDLTDAQVAAWRSYATGTPVVNNLGASIVLQANAMAAKVGVPRIQGSLPWDITLAPTIKGLSELTTPSGLDVSGTTIDFSTTLSDDWRGNGGGLFVYASLPQSNGILFFKGPFQLVGVVRGGVVPPPAAQSLTIPASLAPGGNGVRFVRFIASDPTYRPSSEVILRGPIT